MALRGPRDFQSKVTGAGRIGSSQLATPHLSLLVQVCQSQENRHFQVQPCCQSTKPFQYMPFDVGFLSDAHASLYKPWCSPAISKDLPKPVWRQTNIFWARDRLPSWPARGTITSSRVREKQPSAHQLSPAGLWLEDDIQLA